MKFTTALFLILLGTVTIAHAQPVTPCPSPPTGVTFNPNLIVVNLPEQTTMESDGVTPRITDYQFAYFTQGANPATATPVAPAATISRSAFTLLTGSVDCYTAPVSVAPIPASTVPLVAAIKARRGAAPNIETAESAWSVVGNPFGSAPVVLKTPGPPTIKR